MTTQFIRKASLIVGAGNEAIDLSEMHFNFQTTASYLPNPNTALIRVYNLSRATARKILDMGAIVQLIAGYEGNAAQIFSGNIIQARIGSENATDTFLDISAADGSTIYNSAFMNFTLANNSDMKSRIGTVALAIGVKIGSYTPNTPEKSVRGRVFFGLARDHLRNMASTVGATWTIQNGELDIIGQSAYKPGDIPVLTAASGVIGVPEVTLDGIEVKLLLNPNIITNGQVQLDNSLVTSFLYPAGFLEQFEKVGWVPLNTANGIYKVLYVEHQGDTRGDDWYTKIVCYGKVVNESQFKYINRVIS